MHPAYSVLIFTTASGAGYGLIVFLCLFGAIGVIPPFLWLGLLGFGLAFTLVTAGLLASTYHLGHPERAWRAVSQWRSSWLSREGVMAIATYVPVGLFAIGWVFFGATNGVWAALGVLGATFALITIYCTGMIYQSLKTIRQWHSEWVTPIYVMLGLGSGALWFNFLLQAFDVGEAFYGWVAVALLLIGLLAKFGYWHSIDTTKPLRTAGHATGLGRLGQVRQWETAHTQENYVQREMGFKIARKHAHKLRVYAILAAFIVPLLLSLAIIGLESGLAATLLAGLAAVIAMLGLMIERWLFFAEAQHVVTLYYGAETA